VFCLFGPQRLFGEKGSWLLVYYVHLACLVANYKKHFVISVRIRTKSHSLAQVKFGYLGTKNISLSTLLFFVEETLRDRLQNL
jgi:hypothetical protein